MHLFLLILCNNGRGVGDCNGATVGIGAVGNKLHRGFTRMNQVLLEALFEHYSQIQLTFSQPLLHLVHGLDITLKRKVTILFDSLHNTGGKCIGSGIINGYPDIPHLHVDGEAKQQDLHDGHAEDHQQCSVIPQDMIVLFTYKSDQLFHFYEIMRIVYLLWAL